MIIDFLSRQNYERLTIVAPDAGGAERARAYAKRLDAELAVIDKRRSDDGTAEVMNVIGEVRGRTCVIADDIIDTAGTIQKGAQALQDAGAERILACAVHGVLSGPAIDRIEKAPLDKLVITNTIPLSVEKEKCQKIVQLRVGRLLGQAIRSIHEETSVSSLLRSSERTEPTWKPYSKPSSARPPERTRTTALRAAGQIPAVVYGAQKAGDAIAPVVVAVDPKPFMRILHSSSGLNTLITLKVPGEVDARVLVKEVQLDPITHHPLHADFYRVNMDRRIRVTVPVVLKGEPRGVKLEGGVLDFLHREIEMECLPAEIPNAIEVDVSGMNLNDAVYVRDVAKDVTWQSVTELDTMLAHVVTLRVVEEPAPGADAAAAPVAAAAGTEPEVIKKGKPEKEGDAKPEKKK